MAVVQLRVNPNGRTYSTFTEQDKEANSGCAEDESQKEPEVLEVPEVQKSDEEALVLPLSKRHVELFTKMSGHPLKTTIRTDTVSTILEQDSEQDYEKPDVLGNYQFAFPIRLQSTKLQSSQNLFQLRRN